MDKILVFGDLHLRDDYPYFWEGAERFRLFLKNHPDNTPNTVTIFLGDLTEKHSNSGKVISQLVKIMKELKGPKIILGGNHDKKIDLSEGQFTFSFEFLQDVELNTTVILEPQELSLCGLSILAIPHFGHEEEIKSLLQQPQFQHKTYDLLIGHFGDETAPIPEKLQVPINHLSFRKVLLGHIHKAENDRYLGSIFPNNIAENGPRFYEIYKNNQWKRHPLPNFLTFYSVTYPEDLPQTTADIPVFTVYGCVSEEIAKQKYPQIYLRKVLPSLAKSTAKPTNSYSSLEEIRKYFGDREKILESFLEIYPKEPELATILRKYFLKKPKKTSFSSS